MTTATALTPAEVLSRLEELLSATADYAIAEDKMQRISGELEGRQDDWTAGLEHFGSAVHYEITAALSWHERDDTALQTCQNIQDAIDVLKFAMERNDGH